MSKDASDVEGLLLIDKPSGPTSHDVVDKVRRISDLRRVGHTGTLDPLASGLMFICIGRTTRLAEYLSDMPKSYHATIRLGQETDSFDSEGILLRERPVSLSAEELNLALDTFRGHIAQKPPMFSAKKIKGKPLYILARMGQKVSIPERSVTVYQLELTNWELPYLELLISCSAGTYIRSIAHDLGILLKCGGHITALRRIAIGDFSVDESVSLSKLTQKNWWHYLRPTDTAVLHLPQLTFSEQDSLYLLNGRCVRRGSEHPRGPLARAYDSNGHFVGIVLLENDQWRGKKIFYKSVVN